MLTQQVGFEADRHAFGASGEAAVLGERSFVGGKALGHPVVASPDEVGEGLRSVFVQSLGQLVQADRLADLVLRLSVGHQVLALFAGGFGRQVFGLY